MTGEESQDKKKSDKIFSSTRAKVLAVNDQEWEEARDWILVAVQEQPDLLFAISKYLNDSVDETGTEITPGMLRTIKSLAKLGWGILIHELGEKIK